MPIEMFKESNGEKPKAYLEATCSDGTFYLHIVDHEGGKIKTLLSLDNRGLVVHQFAKPEGFDLEDILPFDKEGGIKVYGYYRR